MASRLEDTTTDEEAFNDYCKEKGGGGQRGELQIELSDLDVQVDSDDDLDRFLGVNKSNNKKAKSGGEYSLVPIRRHVPINSHTSRH